MKTQVSTMCPLDFSYSLSSLCAFFRSLDQNSVSSEPVVPTSRSPARAQPQAPPPSNAHHPPRHLSDSAALQYQHWDQRQRDHPLTRLEIALAEVQRCPTPDNQGEGGFGPARSLSVLEKVSRFERRERAGTQHGYSSSKGSHLRVGENFLSTKYFWLSCRILQLFRCRCCVADGRERKREHLRG